MTDITQLSKEHKRLLLNKNWRVNHLYKIKDRNSLLSRYKRNKAQKHFAKNRHTFNIILKSRRLGFSTEEDIDMIDDVLWGIIRPDKQVAQIDALIIAQTDDDARRIFQDKVALAWEHFPFKQWYNVDTERSNMLRFGWGKDEKTGGENFSSIQVSNSGRGGGFHRVHISEFGKICAQFPERAREIISGTIPTIPDGGQLTIESTAEGSQGYFHDMFWDAWNWQKNNPDKQLLPRQYKAHFYNWQWDIEEISKISLIIPPAELPAFFQEQQRKHNLTDQELTYYYQKWLSLGKDTNLLKREYPVTPEEAFDNAARQLFPSDALDHQKQFVKTPTNQGAWRVYTEPNPQHIYAIGADPSEGSGNDNAAAAILDFSTPKPQVVATFLNDHTTPDMFAFELKRMGLYYNTALIAVERNSMGAATITKLKDIYPLKQLFHQHQYEKDQATPTEKIGWHTNISTKAKMVYDFHSALIEQAIEIQDPELIHQLRTYERDDANTTKMKKDQPYHWDLPIATFIAYQMRTHLNPTVTPKTYIASRTTSVYTTSNNDYDRYAAI